MEVLPYKETRLCKVVFLAQNKEKLYECELNIIYIYMNNNMQSVWKL